MIPTVLNSNGNSKTGKAERVGAMNEPKKMQTRFWKMTSAEVV